MNEFIENFTKNYLLNEKYDLQFLFNFDETSLPRDSTGNYTIAKTGTKHVIVKT